MPQIRFYEAKEIPPEILEAMGITTEIEEKEISQIEKQLEELNKEREKVKGDE